MINIREYFAAILILFIFSLITFKDVIAGSYVFSSHDQMSASAIGKGLVSYEKEWGHYPKWNPWIFSGLPTSHSMQHVSRYYPPNHIMKGMADLGLPWFWNYFLHFIFAGMGCFILLMSLKSGFWSAVFGSLGFMLTPYMVTMIVHGHGSQMMTAAYIPWVFWGLHQTLKNPCMRNTGILALLMGLQLLRGHIQIAYYTWLLEGSYLLIVLIKLLLSKNYKNISGIFHSVSAMVISLIISMIMYYPAKSYAPFSIRGGSDSGGTGFEYATQWSFSMGEMLTFFNPSYYGFGGSTYWGNMPFTDYPNYMGILLLTLAIYAVYRVSGHIKLVLLFSGISALLLSFGKNMIFYQLFYDYFPYFNKFRVPAMFLILVQFSVAILGGLGLKVLLSESQQKYKKAFLSLAGIISGILIISKLISGNLLKTSGKSNVNINSFRLEMVHDDMIRVLLILISGVVLIHVIKHLKLKLPIIGVGCLLILGFDLGVVNQNIIHPNQRNLLMKTTQFSRQFKEDEIIRYLKKDKTDFRILPLGPLMNDNRWAAFQLKNAGGYHPAKLANYQKMISEVGFNSFGFLQMMNIKYLISLESFNHPLFLPVFEGFLNYQGKNVKTIIYENKLPHNSVFIPRKAIIKQDRKEITNELKMTAYSPLDSVFVNKDTSEVSNRTAIGKIIEKSNSPDVISCRVNMISAGLVVFSEVFYPNGWMATVDDNVVEIIEVNGLLRGVYVDEGEHEINMKFDPQDLKTGRILSFIGWVIVIGMLGYGIIPRKKSGVKK